MQEPFKLSPLPFETYLLEPYRHTILIPKSSVPGFRMIESLSFPGGDTGG